jgi:16S rRNA processing protein RimM
MLIGRVLRPWGLKGSVKVEPWTHDPARFRRLRRLTVRVGTEAMERQVVECAIDPSGFVRLSFAGVATVEDAERLRGASLLIDEAEVERPADGTSYFNHELLGCDVWTTSGRHLGRVEEILETGATNVLAVRSEGHEYLIPAALEHLARVDLALRRIEVEPIPGLLDLNEPNHAL